MGLFSIEFAIFYSCIVCCKFLIRHVLLFFLVGGQSSVPGEVSDKEPAHGGLPEGLAGGDPQTAH